MPTKLLILITISSENIIIKKKIYNDLPLVKLYIMYIGWFFGSTNLLLHNPIYEPWYNPTSWTGQL